MKKTSQEESSLFLGDYRHLCPVCAEFIDYKDELNSARVSHLKEVLVREGVVQALRPQAPEWAAHVEYIINGGKLQIPGTLEYLRDSHFETPYNNKVRAPDADPTSDAELRLGLDVYQVNNLLDRQFKKRLPKDEIEI